MTVLTASDFAQQMIGQARVLDPSFSGEVGTPERVIIDTFAQSLADNQIDLTGLQGALDIDSKFGANLDRFTALFGFQRQQPAAATGFVVFSRITPAPATITIPANTPLQANTTAEGGTVIQYATISGGSIPTGQTSSAAVPVQAVVTGTVGNVAANTINVMVGPQVPPGVTSVTNPNALTNGTDAEDDNSFKVRFKNTWARNLAGVSAQYLALAIAGPFTTKANVVGVQSRYQEYVQVPDYDDAGYLNGTKTVIGLTNGIAAVLADTLGIQNQWTTALSTIPYAKQIYTNVQTYVSNGQQDGSAFFYRPGVDYQFNFPPILTGDTVRDLGTAAQGNQSVSSGTTLHVYSTFEFPTSGTLIGIDRTGGTPVAINIQYTGLTSSPTPGFLGCTNSGAGFQINDGDPVDFVPPGISITPNFTLLNVYNPSSPQSIPGLQAVAPGDVILTEYGYVSSASRNDLAHNITNAVDVYVNGVNSLTSTDLFLLPVSWVNLGFTTDPTSPWYFENYRRDGAPTTRPHLNNFITPLFQIPTTTLPSTITISGQNFYEGTHYWLVHEVDTLGGSVRARDGIEWNTNLAGDAGGFPVPGDPLAPYSPTGGHTINTFPTNTTVQINDYQYDSNIPITQASIEAARQITTDVLVHKAATRYFKLDITIVYSPSASFAVVNAAIATTLQAYFDRQYFGAQIQLSTLLEVIHDVSGVENVRWSNDLPTVPDLIRVCETDVNGNPVHGASIDRWLTNPSNVEKQTLYIVGNPVGTFTLSWTDPILPASHTLTTAPINFRDGTGQPVSALTIQNAIRTAATTLGVGSGKYYQIVVTQDVRPTLYVTEPILSYTVLYGATGIPYLPSISQAITSSDKAYDTDFTLLDNQLPSLALGALPTDTLPGLIIRPRAQSTFFRPGLG